MIHLVLTDQAIDRDGRSIAALRGNTRQRLDQLITGSSLTGAGRQALAAFPEENT